VAIVRIEQLAPLPRRRLNETLDRYPNAEQFFWVQEEPANQGAWPTFGLTMPELLPEKLKGLKRISRRAMSAPSSGSSKVHAVEQQEIIDEAFG
jgi:2-oxoglutarate decarboxylase